MTARVSDILPAAAPHASRPAAPDTAPALFSCSDHHVIYRWDGAAWSTWLDVSALLGGITLDSLSDVDLTGQANGDFLSRVGGIWTPVDAPSGGGGGSTDPRSVFSDDCASAALPAGVTAAGTSFEANDVERLFTGVASYETPTFPLRGTVVVEADVTQRTNYTAGQLDVQIMKGASVVAKIALAVDSNIVVMNSAGTPVGNINTGGTSAGLTDGTAVHLGLSVDKSGLCTATVSAITGGSGTSNANGQQAWGVQTLKWASGLAGLAAGDNLTVKLSQNKPGATARVTAVTRLTVTRGSRAR